MVADHGAPQDRTPAGKEVSLEERLERAELAYYPLCPFALPEGEDRLFLFRQELAGRAHKNISYDPKTDKVAGFRRQSQEQAQRLRRLLAHFAAQATSWLAAQVPS